MNKNHFKKSRELIRTKQRSPFWNNKKAIELSVNFLVIMIIAITVFGMGIRMTYKLMTKAEEIREDVDESTQREIEEALTSGQIVSIPINHKKVRLAKSASFGLGIFNTGDIQSFIIDMIFEKAFGTDREDISSTVIESDWIKTSFGPFDLNKNENKVIGLPVRVPRKSGDVVTLPGTYIFKIEVKDGNGNRYGNVQKIYVEVI